MTRASLVRWLAVFMALALLGGGAARALPALGGPAPSTARFEDVDGHALALRLPPGRPVLVLYEDKSSATQNAALKADLATLATGERYRAIVGLVPVADVSAYDYWPVRGFVASAIRDESKKVGTAIYCDWSGAFRNAFGFHRGVSTVVLLARDGRVLFVSEGALAPSERSQLIELLRAEVEAIGG